MPEKAVPIETVRCGSLVEETLQNTLRKLGGREIRGDDIWHADERYGVSIKGRRFVFRDPVAFHRFKEELNV